MTEGWRFEQTLLFGEPQLKQPSQLHGVLATALAPHAPEAGPGILPFLQPGPFLLFYVFCYGNRYCRGQLLFLFQCIFTPD